MRLRHDHLASWSAEVCFAPTNAATGWNGRYGNIYAVPDDY